MPKSSSKKKQKHVKKRKRSHTDRSQETLSNVCNVAGLDDGLAGLGGADNVMDCLEEMAWGRVQL